MADIIAAQELINRYPASAPEMANVNMPYPTFGGEALALLALAKQKDVAERLEACGLRKEAWTELAAAHQDLVSAQAHWGAARTFGIADAAIQVSVDRLEFLRDEMLAQAAFYLRSDDDQKRVAEVREGDGLPDMIADCRALVLMIRPKRQLILDPEFKTECLDEALALAEKLETARASRAAESAVASQGQEMRRVRDRAVARVHALMTEIRDYGKHAYRRSPKLSAAFASEYLRRKRRKAAGQQESETPVTPSA
jgi:hypothetical protein